jgi:hypothetical protein
VTPRRPTAALAAPLAALLLLASAPSCNEEEVPAAAATTPAARQRTHGPTLGGGCPETAPLTQLDLNRDGRFDLLVVADGDGTCRAADLNFDGAFDLYRHRDASGNVLREEADGDFDGRLDSVAVYRGPGDPAHEEFDTNWDGVVDLWVDLYLSCAFLQALPGTCTSECGVSWCQPRTGPAVTETGEPTSTSIEAPSSISALYRDANGDGLWDVGEVLFGDHPICVGFNTNPVGDVRDRVRPEAVEVYKPASATIGRPDIDYLRRDYLDLSGNPITRCEDGDGAVTDCPLACGR